MSIVQVIPKIEKKLIKFKTPENILDQLNAYVDFLKSKHKDEDVSFDYVASELIKYALSKDKEFVDYEKKLKKEKMKQEDKTAKKNS